MVRCGERQAESWGQFMRIWHGGVSFCLPLEYFAGMLIARELIELFKMTSSKNLEKWLSVVSVSYKL